MAMWVMLLTACIGCWLIRKRKISYTTLFGIMGLFICFQVYLEASIFPVFKDSYSSRPFAEKIEAKYDLKGNTYVLNDLTESPNMYGLNFYTGNHFRNFEKELPAKGYFITGSKMIDKIRMKYAGKYDFEVLDQSDNKYNDFNDVMVVYNIIKLDK